MDAMTKTALERIPPLERADGKLPAGAVHAHLRALMLDGSLPPGTVLPQVELARRLGVSRTPLREALRMLQEEGLVEAEPNRRARVTGFDPGDLDTLYSARVLLEALGVELTVKELTDPELEEIEQSLAEMRSTAADRDIEAWEVAHTRFHGLLVSRAGEQLRRMIGSYADQSERYRRLRRMIGSYADQSERYPRLYQVAEPRAWSVGDAEHEAIVDACRRREPHGAAVQLARHLAHTALSIIAQLAPEQEPRHVRTALLLVTRGEAAATLVAPLPESSRPG